MEMSKQEIEAMIKAGQTPINPEDSNFLSQDGYSSFHIGWKSALDWAKKEGRYLDLDKIWKDVVPVSTKYLVLRGCNNLGLLTLDSIHIVGRPQPKMRIMTEGEINSKIDSATNLYLSQVKKFSLETKKSILKDLGISLEVEDK